MFAPNFVSMMFSVYILFSEKLARFYTGTTDDVMKRMHDHNNKSHPDAFTRNGIPWTLYLLIDRLSSQQAYNIERHIKHMKSKKYIQNLKTHPQMIDSLKELYK